MSEAAGDWDVRGIGLDAAFIGRLSDTALTATLLTRDQFDSRFPGWELYRATVAGDVLSWGRLEAYAIGMARAVSRAKRRTGHPVVRKSLRRKDWIAQAGRDALYLVVHGKQAMPVSGRSDQFDIDPDVYSRVMKSVAGGMTIGLETYRAFLFLNYQRARRLDSGL